MKSIVAVALFALVAVATCSPTPKAESAVTKLIRQLLEANRDKLADISIPSLTVYETGLLENLLIQGVEKVVIEKLEAPGPLSLDISNATISVATVAVSADVTAVNTVLPDLGVTVNGQGPLTATVTGIKGSAALDIALKGAGVELKDFSGLYIEVQSIKALLTGIDNQDAVNDAINTKLAPFINAELANIANENKEAILAVINEVLGGISP